LQESRANRSETKIPPKRENQDSRLETRNTKHETSNSSNLSNLKRIKWYERDAHTHFDVCADDHCQRYQGITRASTNAVVKAIEATRGEVLWADGEICDARFSKSCGGASETFENCWAPEHYSYLTKVIDNPVEPEGFELDLTLEANAERWIRLSPEAFCNTTDKKVLAQVLNNYDQETTDFYRWKVEYTQAEISELLARRSGIDFGEIVDMIPVKRGESARLIELKIVGTKQTITVGKELEIRKWLSNSHLYSSAFVVDKLDIKNGIPEKFVLTGAGWGHGVGLCQIGAAVMGEKGYLYNEILLHYFKGAELKRIYTPNP
jgi:stage II sporulation protein D